MKFFSVSEKGVSTTVIELADRFEARKRFPGMVGIVVCNNLMYDREYRTKIKDKQYIFRIAPTLKSSTSVICIAVKEEAVEQVPACRIAL